MFHKGKKPSTGKKKSLISVPVALAILCMTVSAGCAKEPQIPETFTQETFVAVAPGEAEVTLRSGLTSQDFDDQAQVQDWLASCEEAGRADIGVYALCYRTTEGESTVYRWLIRRTGTQASYHTTATIEKGNSYTVTVTYAADVTGTVGADGLILVTATLPAGEKPMLDLVEGDDYLGPLITYTDTDFGI